MHTYRIGELARQTGCKVETIRFYESVGLLPLPARGASGHRLYADADRRRLTFIRRAPSRFFHGGCAGAPGFVR